MNSCAWKVSQSVIPLPLEKSLFACLSSFAALLPHTPFNFTTARVRSFSIACLLPYAAGAVLIDVMNDLMLLKKHFVDASFSPPSSVW